MLSLIRTLYIRRLPLDEGHGRISSPRSFMWMYLNIDGLDAGLANFWVVRIKMFLFLFPFCSTRARIVYTVCECTFEYTRSTQIFVLIRQNPMPLNVPVFFFIKAKPFYVWREGSVILLLVNHLSFRTGFIHEGDYHYVEYMSRHGTTCKSDSVLIVGCDGILYMKWTSFFTYWVPLITWCL